MPASIRCIDRMPGLVLGACLGGLAPQGVDHICDVCGSISTGFERVRPTILHPTTPPGTPHPSTTTTNPPPGPSTTLPTRPHTHSPTDQLSTRHPHLDPRRPTTSRQGARTRHLRKESEEEHVPFSVQAFRAGLVGGLEISKSLWKWVSGLGLRRKSVPPAWRDGTELAMALPSLHGPKVCDFWSE